MSEHVYGEGLYVAKKWSYRHQVLYQAELFTAIGAAYFSPFL
jgi:hypothetical protein